MRSPHCFVEPLPPLPNPFHQLAVAGPGFMSLTNYLIPLWAVGVGYLFLDEIPERSAVAALILILGGVALGQGRPASPETQCSLNSTTTVK